MYRLNNSSLLAQLTKNLHRIYLIHLKSIKPKSSIKTLIDITIKRN